MSLEKWVEYGWLGREPTSPGEIKDLLGIVDRSLADSKVEAVSTDLRFIAAFNAALCIATTALRASGRRTVTQAGRHVRTIESLEGLHQNCLEGPFHDHSIPNSVIFEPKRIGKVASCILDLAVSKVPQDAQYQTLPVSLKSTFHSSPLSLHPVRAAKPGPFRHQPQRTGRCRILPSSRTDRLVQCHELRPLAPQAVACRRFQRAAPFLMSSCSATGWSGRLQGTQR
jgi:hypothetical protein